MAIKVWRRRGPVPFPSTVVALGNFDGIHRGHQAILQKTYKIAQQMQALPLLLTFSPSPQAFFHPDHPQAILTSLREKSHWLAQHHINHLYVFPFNQALADYSAQQFIDHILIDRLHAKAIVVGKDFRFGHQRQGDTALLQQQTAFQTHLNPTLNYQQQRISSSWIRQTLTAGDLILAQQLLGHPYMVMGHVIHGDKRGRQLGFPTANIGIANRILPLAGVFVVKIKYQHHNYFGVANVGVRPTLAKKRLSLEVFIFNFQKEIYGQLLHITFLKKLRDEKSFTSLDALKQQITHDVMQARQYIDNLSKNIHLK